MFLLTRVVKNLDIFGAEVPGLNLRGQTKVKTFAGAFVSLAIMGITVMFALLKLQFMLMRKQPEVNEFVEPEFFSPSDSYKLHEEDFMMAISMENYLKGERMDPRYIQFVATLISKNEESFLERYVPMKPCTDEQFDKFY